PPENATPTSAFFNSSSSALSGSDGPSLAVLLQNVGLTSQNLASTQLWHEVVCARAIVVAAQAIDSATRTAAAPRLTARPPSSDRYRLRRTSGCCRDRHGDRCRRSSRRTACRCRARAAADPD